MNKKYFLLLCLILTTLVVQAGKHYAPVEKGCYAKGGCLLTGYVSPAVKLTILNNISTAVYGANAGLLLSLFDREHALGIGLVSYNLFNREIGLDDDIFLIGGDIISRIRSDAQPASLLEFQYFGAYAEWIFSPLEDIHGGIRFTFAWGILNSESNQTQEAKISIYQPEFFFQANLTHWLLLDWGFQFRIIPKSTNHLNSFFDRSQLGTELRLRFGWFDIEPEIKRK